MRAVRDARRQVKGRLPLTEKIASHLPAHAEPSIESILEAIKRCGWVGAKRHRGISISFSASRPPCHYDFDLFRRGVIKAWHKIRGRSRKKQKALPPYDQLTDAVHRYVQRGVVPAGSSNWLDFSASGIAPTAELIPWLTEKNTDADELRDALRAANELLLTRVREKEADRDRTT
jgi:hypothetical protein